MDKIVNLSRRDFLKASAVAGGGLVLGFYLPFGGRSRLQAAELNRFAPNAFLRIDGSGTVTVLVPQSDMGQGVLTSMPMIVADELDAAWKDVRFEQAPADKAYTNPIIGMQLTGGSSSIRAFYEPLRKAGAAARTMLVSAAAQTWAVDAGDCRTESGSVIHPSSGKKLEYGKLVEKASTMAVPKSFKLKEPADFKIIGTPTNRLDNQVKVDGSGVFGLDVRQPGMLTAAVSRCPVFGGKAVSFDASEAKQVPGVRQIVEISTGVAVVADNFWAAKKGRDLLKVKWNEGSLANLSTAGIFSEFEKAAGKPGPTARNDGDVQKAFGSASKKIEALYRVPYLAHANMEPMNCTAHVHGNVCEVWAPTQGQTLVQRFSSKVTGLPPESVIVNTTFLGTGFGRRAEQDFLTEAVELSKAMGVPVKVVWTREDDMRHDHYRPSTYNRLTAGLDKKGMPQAWMHRIVGPSIFGAHAAIFGMAPPAIDRSSIEGAADLPYNIPNMRVEYIRNEPGIPVGFWRSVGHSQNTFITESFLDEVAAASKKDPFELRRTLLGKHPRLLAVLETAASNAGWGKPLPKGRFRGIAAAEAYGSFVSEVVEASVSQDKSVRVHRVVCAIDCGQNINPRTIEAQMEGGIVFGLTAALKDAITIDRGRVVQSNFHNYPMLRMNEMPDVEVHIIKSREAPGGVGETGVPVLAPALCGAIFAATGKRIRELPIQM
ncbi:MAG: Isoquinoline 1-oxidoreductase subunit beta [Syntrophus sp. SKADARSKE-3]|nr:Isoquinoline 1-oxidoreductase subunit beta [Syntrophus sp. SKADARSKE-3]